MGLEHLPHNVPTPSAPLARRAFPVLLVLTLAAGLTITNYWLISQPALSQYQAMRDRVLRNHARNFYQYDMYFLSQVDETLRTRLHLRPIAALTTLFAGAYLLALAGSWYWLAQHYRRPGPVVAGLLATGLYALLMLPFSYHHPSDMAALGCFAFCLGLAVRRRTGWLLGVSLLAGLFSSKQVLILLPLLLQYLEASGWRRAALVSGAGAVAALAVPLYYRFWLLGPHDIVATGTLEAGQWQQMLPYALLVHLVLAAAPLASLYSFPRRLTPTLTGAMGAYLLLLVICILQLNIIHELRTFWLGVPAFAAALAMWTDADAPPPPAATGTGESQ